jgi:hypothetical protein
MRHLGEPGERSSITALDTLEFAHPATRDYVRRTAAIALVAMVLVGALVGLGLEDEPYVRDGIGGLIIGLGPFMGWRTSRASAMVAGDRLAATANGTTTAASTPAQPNRFADLLNTLATAATVRVASRGSDASHSGASGPPSPGANHLRSRRQGPTTGTIDDASRERVDPVSSDFGGLANHVATSSALRSRRVRLFDCGQQFSP